MADFQSLRVWQHAHELALRVHDTAMGINGPEYTALRSQLIRAAFSVPTNIVEGREQNSEKDFSRFLRYAINSASEVEYHLIVARDTKRIPPTTFLSLQAQTVLVRKMIYGLLKTIGLSAVKEPTVVM